MLVTTKTFERQSSLPDFINIHVYSNRIDAWTSSKETATKDIVHRINTTNYDLSDVIEILHDHGYKEIDQP